MYDDDSRPRTLARGRSQIARQLAWVHARLLGSRACFKTQVGGDQSQCDPADERAEGANEGPVAREPSQARRVGQGDPRLDREDGRVGPVGLDAEAEGDLREPRTIEGGERGRCDRWSARRPDRLSGTTELDDLRLPRLRPARRLLARCIAAVSSPAGSVPQVVRCPSLGRSLGPESSSAPRGGQRRRSLRRHSRSGLVRGSRVRPRRRVARRA